MKIRQVKDTEKYQKHIHFQSAIIYYIIGRQAQNVIYHEMDPFFFLISSIDTSIHA